MIDAINQNGIQAMMPMMSTSGPPDAKGMQDMMNQMVESNSDSIAEQLGMDTETFTSLHTDIQDAVQQAVNESDGTGDMRSTIKGAVNGVLEENGIDPSEFHATMKSFAQQSGMPQKGMMPTMGGMGGMNGMFGMQPGGVDQNDMMSQLLESLSGEEDSDQESGVDTYNYLQNLKPGSIADSFA